VDIAWLPAPRAHAAEGEGVPTVEHLTGLEALPSEVAWSYAVPGKVKAFGSFPVRALAEVKEGRG